MNGSVEIGQRLLYFRKKLLSKTINDVCNEIGVNKNTLRAWESGESSISAKSITKLINLYKLNPTWLFTGTENPLLGNENPQTKPSLTADIVPDVYIPYDINLKKAERKALDCAIDAIDKAPIGNYKLAKGDEARIAIRAFRNCLEGKQLDIKDVLLNKDNNEQIDHIE